MYIYMYMCVCVCLCVCVVYMITRACVSLSLYIYIYMCVCACVCVCVYKQDLLLDNSQGLILDKWATHYFIAVTTASLIEKYFPCIPSFNDPISVQNFYQL